MNKQKAQFSKKNSFHTHNENSCSVSETNMTFSMEPGYLTGALFQTGHLNDCQDRFLFHQHTAYASGGEYQSPDADC